MRRIPRPSPSMVVALIALVVAVVGSAYAAGEGRPLLGGTRNPGSDKTKSLTRETQIIANLSRYGTRQSNKSNNGGGAIYGCRSGPGGTPANNEPCIRANNLSGGLAFEFAASGGDVAGTITTKDANGRPFTTNATGVATGLNADRLDGKEAADFLGKTEAAAALADFTRLPLTRVAATVGATLADARAAAPEVPIAQKGPLTVYGKCFANPTIVNGEVYARTTADGSVLVSDDADELTGNGTPFLNAGTAESDRVAADVAAEAVPAAAQTQRDLENDFAALAPDGASISGRLDLLAVQSGFGGGGAWGSGNACWFGGTLITGP